MAETKAFYAGSFDPPTNGHLEVIKAGAELFEDFHVDIGLHPDKSYLFTLEERVRMLEVVTGDIRNVKIGSYCGKLLIEHAVDEGFTHIVRGIRTAKDLEDERVYYRFGETVDRSVQTVLIPCAAEFEIVSSSFVKGLMTST
ncbi:pantetheine-phosphate adenylyltransferase, partial [Candidatus Saccharibacteria bacterium]|nr:pantetheine-phosphate adenylyltransferase [Candidatus Saccharibacteria bacterium]